MQLLPVTNRHPFNLAFPSRTSCSPANPRSHCFHIFSPFVLKCCDDFCAQRSNLGEPEIFHLRPRPWGGQGLQGYSMRESPQKLNIRNSQCVCVCFLTNSVLQSRPEGCSDVQFQGGERNLCHFDGGCHGCVRSDLSVDEDEASGRKGQFKVDSGAI